ncbi:MAG: DNA-binding transcriptional regulator, partial [Lachnospiraceae bacterium]|nr:DNA-binding transcriptional regulator [Lachnospiraceae bacterium]
DIALLRTAGYDILSTRRGYILQEGASCRRVFHVTHDDLHTEDELNIFVDAGGRVLDVFVEHDVYGLIRGELNISSRRQVREFMENLKTGKAVPLKALTCDEHWHTVIADSEETLDFIQGELAQRGYLLDD